MIEKFVLPFHRIHELANRYPLMSEEEREVLKQSLLKSGQLNPIYLFDGEIIDGRNRYLVMKELAEKGQLSFKPKIETYPCKKEDLPTIVEALNVHRRHLSPSQKAAIGVKNYLPIQRQLAQERQQKGVSVNLSEGGKTAEIIAKMVGVSTTYIEKAIKVITDTELFSLLEDGKINVVDAEIVASNATSEQRQEIINKIMHDGKGVRYNISLITPRKKHKVKIAEIQQPLLIVMKNLDADDDKTQLIKEKIRELRDLLISAGVENSEIWYQPTDESNNAFKGELERLYKKIQPKRLGN